MHKIGIAAILVLCAVFIGCGTAIKITQYKSGKIKCLPGVPFYTKAVVCKHDTAWLEPTYKLMLIGTLIPTEKSSPLFNVSKEIFQAGYISEEFKKLRNYISKNDSNKKDILDAFDALAKYEYTSPAEGSNLKTRKGLILACNQNEPVTFVDYTNPYYFNARIPLAGSVNPDISLSPDLTLSKASVNIQEQTLKTLLDMLPVKEVLSGVGKALVPALGRQEEKLFAVQLTTEQQVYKYTLSKIGPKATELPCKEPGDPLYEIGKATFLRTLMSADELKKEKDEGKKIKFSGNVDLPK